MSDLRMRTLEREALAGDLGACVTIRRERQRSEVSALTSGVCVRCKGLGEPCATYAVEWPPDCKGTGRRVLSWQERNALAAYCGDELARLVEKPALAGVCALFGHDVVSDLSMRPEDDYCLHCGEDFPGLAPSRRPNP